jgi:uncharacterized protein
MAEIAAQRERTPARNAIEVAVALGAGTAALWSVGNLSIPQISNFLLVFGSLLVEAVPFILLGATVSAAIEVFVPGRYFERLAGLPRGLQLPACGLAGFAFPVCECGSVPVARRLARKGLAPSSAITFMLAAPIVNPVVIASTFVAYRGREILWPMVLGRTVLCLLCAIAVGWVVGNRRSDLVPPADTDESDHEHAGRQESFFGHLAGDFVFMGRYLVVGAAVAAAMQTFVPQSIIGSIAGTAVVDILAMMGLAFLLSLCSESDAFVAASFVQFGAASQLAFLVFGPMVDMKLLALYLGVFGPGVARTILVASAAATLVGSLWLQVVVG